MNVYQKGYFCFEVIFVVLIVALVASLSYVKEKQCEAISQKMQLRSEWGFMTGCMVEAQNGSWVNINKYYITKDGD